MENLKIVFLISIFLVFFTINISIADDSLNDILIVDNKIIEKPGEAKIDFKEEINVDENILNSNIYIDNNLVAINTKEIPELDKPATITFYNLFFEETPIIYYNEEFTTNPYEVIIPCPEDICYNINYDKENGILTFDVAHFSTIVLQGPPCPTPPYPDWGGWNGWCGDFAAEKCALVEQCAANPNSNPVYCKIYPYNDPNYCKKNIYPYDGSVGCYPTAYCAQFNICFARFVSSGEYHEYSCGYIPSTGIQEASCNIREIFQNSIIEAECNTCENSKACQKADEGLGYRCDASSTFCQPRVCDKEDTGVGECYWNGGNLINIDDGSVEYQESKDYFIGDKICNADTKKWQVCNNQDNDPCGEWDETDLSCYECKSEMIEYKTKDKFGFDKEISLCEVDLRVLNIKPIQVIEDVSLIENKPTMVRVSLDFKADPPIVNMTKGVDVYLYYGAALVGKKTIDVIKREIWDKAIDTVKKIENGENLDIYPYMDILKKIKNGEDTVNFFDINVLEEVEEFTAIVDPSDEIKETYDKTDNFDPESNNKESKNIKIIKKNVFVVLPVYVRLASEKNDVEIINIAFDTAKENYEFMRKVYPLDPTKTKLLEGTKILIGASKEMLDNPDVKKRLKYKNNLRRMIFKRLQEELAEPKKVNLIIGMVDPGEILEIKDGTPSGLSIPGYDKVVLLSVKRDGAGQVEKYTVAHEYGHILGLYVWGAEQYDKYPTYGYPASNGWCLDQDSGESCGPKINIWTKLINGKFMTSFDFNERTQDPSEKLGQRYYDFMGSGINSWVHYDTYKTLLDEVK